MLALLALLVIAHPAQACDIDINTATEAEMAERLNGIGAVKAAAIVAYRQEIGLFTDIAQLLDVRGIGPATLQNLQNQICVSGSGNAAVTGASGASVIAVAPDAVTTPAPASPVSDETVAGPAAELLSAELWDERELAVREALFRAVQAAVHDASAEK